MDSQPDSKKTDNILNRIIKKRTNRLIAIAVVVIGVIVYIGFAIKIKIPSNPLSILQKKAAVNLKTEYKNPFAKETQYVNPFQTYKNPFVVSK